MGSQPGRMQVATHQGGSPLQHGQDPPAAVAVRRHGHTHVMQKDARGQTRPLAGVCSVYAPVVFDIYMKPGSSARRGEAWQETMTHVCARREFYLGRETPVRGSKRSYMIAASQGCARDDFLWTSCSFHCFCRQTTSRVHLHPCHETLKFNPLAPDAPSAAPHATFPRPSFRATFCCRRADPP